LINLEKLGWNSFFENEFQIYKKQGFSAGRIAAENRNNYIIYSETGEVFGEVSGKLMFNTDSESDYPKTGDWVVISLFDNDSRAVIHEVLPRKTKFSRKSVDRKTNEQVIAANIDIVFIMQALDDNFNINRLIRYLTAVIESGARPVILLSKSDLCTDLDLKLNEVKKAAPDIATLFFSSVTQTGIKEIVDVISARLTGVIIGSSGVGKSTLINLLAGKEYLKTNSVREADSKGRHTTTRRELILLPSGGLIIDTPGMREFALWNADKGFTDMFGEFYDLAGQCRFSDCTHTHEAGCAVKTALENGAVSNERYLNYLKLRKELHYLETKQDIFAQLEEKRKWKNIHKEAKRINKRR
jgi:ribosome biogenesis GTPase